MNIRLVLQILDVALSLKILLFPCGLKVPFQHAAGRGGVITTVICTSLRGALYSSINPAAAAHAYLPALSNLLHLNKYKLLLLAGIITCRRHFSFPVFAIFQYPHHQSQTTNSMILSYKMRIQSTVHFTISGGVAAGCFSFCSCFLRIEGSCCVC